MVQSRREGEETRYSGENENGVGGETGGFGDCSPEGNLQAENGVGGETGGFGDCSPEGSLQGETGYNKSFEQGRRVMDSNFCMQRMFELMLEENRRRDMLLQNVVERLTPINNNTSGVDVEPSVNRDDAFHVMPDLSRVINTFDGVCNKAL